MMGSRSQVRRLAGVFIVFLLALCWRPTSVSFAFPVLRTHYKRVRNCPSEVPETSLVRSRAREQRPKREGRPLETLIPESASFGSGTSSSATAAAKLALRQNQPTYLRAHLVQDS